MDSEYVVRLQGRISQLDLENACLKNERDDWKNWSIRYMAGRHGPALKRYTLNIEWLNLRNKYRKE